MDGSRFDAWTRRRFGLVAGSFAGSLLALLGRDDSEANKKKRCRKAGQGCKTSGKHKKKCCKNLECLAIEGFGEGKHCCKALNEPCSLEKLECCSGLCSGTCFCKSNGSDCDINANCCSLNCVSGTCQAPVI